MRSTASQEILLSSAEVEIQAASGKPPSVSIVAYTGGLMTVPGWGPVAIDLAGLDAGAEQISLLADHDATLDGIVGHGRAQVIDGKLLVNGTLTGATEAARQVVELARGGFKFQASVGVAPTEYERVRPNDTVQVNGRAITAGRSGFTLVKAGVLREVSIVAIGADANTSVAIAAQGKESTMNEHGTTTDPAIIAETERLNAIRAVCGGRVNDIEARAIREGWDGPRTQLAVLRAGRPTPPLFNTRTFAPTRRTLEAAVLGHMGYEHLAEKFLGATAAQQARDLRATNLIDLCRAALQLDGRDIPSSRDAMIRAALSTYSLPTALGDAANKLLMDAYTETPATWRSFAGIKSATDFKPHTGVRGSDVGDLTQLAPGGEIKHGSIKEMTYPFRIDTFAKMLSLDRRDIVNDDLGLFDEAARNLGRAAMRSLSDLVFQVLLANAGNFFSGGLANYDTGPATALSSASLGAGIAKMISPSDFCLV
jgi:hypothetical protein